jgi:hypothetical protein
VKVHLLHIQIISFFKAKPCTSHATKNLFENVCDHRSISSEVLRLVFFLPTVS